MTETTYRLIRHLKRGEENAKHRKELCYEMSIKDRELRDIVADARAEGHPILSSSKGAGYYLPAIGTQGIDESQRFIAEQVSRIKKLNQSVGGAQNYINRFGGGQTRKEA